mgnify:CR=1 FL=1
MAGASPADVNVAEIHDCFTVMGAIGTEVIGKAGYGEGARYWAEGKADAKGDCGINTSGGLIAKGHPVGATGIAQIVELTEQLQGRCGKGQVEASTAALAHNGGGVVGNEAASMCVTFRLRTPSVCATPTPSTRT